MSDAASQSRRAEKKGASTAAAYAIGIGVPIMIFVLVCGHAYYQHHKSKSAAQNQAPAAGAPPPPPMAVAEPIIAPSSSGPRQRRPGRRHGARRGHRTFGAAGADEAGLGAPSPRQNVGARAGA